MFQLPEDKTVRSNMIELRGLLGLHEFLEVAKCFIDPDVDGYFLAKKLAIEINALYENSALVVHSG